MKRRERLVTLCSEKSVKEWSDWKGPEAPKLEESRFEERDRISS